jgi:predicted negative regulator of RcsB-dependent stress response
VSAYSQQEELERFKEWWKSYGASLVAGVVLGLALLFGYRFWTERQETARVAASALYDQLRQEIEEQKPEAADTAMKLTAEYANTPYAAMAALLVARQKHQSGDTAEVRKNLEWALANAKDDATRHAARLRLARVLIDAKEIERAAALTDEKDIAGFETEYFELKGDLALAQNQRDAARTAYREALKHLSPQSPYRSVLSMKLDDLGPEGQS